MSFDFGHNFLAINTAGKSVEVALCYNNVDDFVFTEQKMASQALLLLIDEILFRNNADINKLDFIAVCIGAGSFTGIRIGLVTAKTLCQVLNKRLLPLTYSQILSYNALGGDKDIYTFSDAGNSLIYGAKFNHSCAFLQQPFCSSLQSIIESIDKDATVVAESALIAQHFGERAVLHNNKTALLKAVKHIYEPQLLTDYSSAEPLYVRQPQAVEDMQRGSKK